MVRNSSIIAVLVLCVTATMALKAHHFKIISVEKSENHQQANYPLRNGF